MKKLKYIAIATLLAIFLSCGRETGEQESLFEKTMESSPAITGKSTYLQSPFVTPGDRLYMVGHQDGSFPEIGWHIEGEMGGIWSHPIKLMDGFVVSLSNEGQTHELNGVPGSQAPGADSFVNYPMANRHKWELDSAGLQVERWQFVPDAEESVFIEYIIQNHKNKPRSIRLDFTGYVDLRPTWLGERTGMEDGPDVLEFDSILQAWVANDRHSPWWVAFGSHRRAFAYSTAESPYQGNGVAATLSYELTLPASGQEVVRFVIAGSHRGKDPALQSLSRLRRKAGEMLETKKTRYEALAAQSELRTPDSMLNKTFRWLKYNADWMLQEVPGIGRGITAGIPDYPWWFGVDSEYALRGYLAVGQTEAVFQTIRLLDSVSRAVNGNGRIIHEMSTNGAVFNPGNTNETAQFASLIWHVYRWTGDRDFLRRYFPTVQKGLDWLSQEKDRDRNGFPDGFGMMEIHGLDSEMIDVASYTQAGFHHASLIAGALGLDSIARVYAGKAHTMKEKINREFWSESFSSFADFMGTDQQALRLIEDAIIRADTLDKPWAVDELKQTRAFILENPQSGQRPFVLHHNWVVNTPMEIGIADSTKAIRALNTARKFTNPFGVFVTGIDRDASAGADEGSFQGSRVFSYTGAVMTLPTGVQAIAENNYGRPDQALDYLKRMTRSFSFALPGSMYEVSPDYGMMVQAWNLFSFAVPVVEQFFGISPDAAGRSVRIKPAMPSAWEKASLEQVQIGENTISVSYERLPGGSVRLEITQDTPGWTLEVPLSQSEARNVSVSSGILVPGTGGKTLAHTTQRVLELQYKPD